MNNLYLGIDSSKGYADFILLDQNKQSKDKSFQLDDTYAGHTALKKYLNDVLRKEEGTVIRCGIESTGGYEQNWYTMLLNYHRTQPNLLVSQVNPKAVKHGHEAAQQRTKTDATSAYSIASYMIGYPEKVDFSQSEKLGNLPEVKALYTMIRGTVKKSTQTSNQLQSLLYQAFPELLSMTKGSMPKWTLKLLEYYPTAGALAEARGKLKSIKYVSEEKLQKLRDKVCQERVASADGDAVRYAIRELVRQYQDLETSEKASKAYLRKTINSPLVDLLVTIPGIAEYSACGLLSAIGDINRFENAGQLAAFFGLHPKIADSGDGKIKSRMSKQGDSTVRAILYMSAVSAVRSNPHFKGIFAKFKAKGMAYHEAIGVIMHKLIRIVFGMLKSGKEFDAKIDQANIDRFKNVAPKEQQELNTTFSTSKRRLQELTNDAPTSKRNAKKRSEFLKQQEQKVIDVNESKEATETLLDEVGAIEHQYETGASLPDDAVYLFEKDNDSQTKSQKSWAGTVMEGEYDTENRAEDDPTIRE